MNGQSSNERLTSAHFPSPPRWRDARSLDLMYQVNGRCLQLFSQAAALGREENLPPVLAVHRELWLALDAKACYRAGRIAALTVDVHLTDAKWWENILNGRAAQGTAASRYRLPEKIAEDLISETLMFIWHAAQSNARNACLTVGMAREVAEMIAGLSAQDIRHIAATYSGEAKLRWSEDLELWRKWLLAAQRGTEHLLSSVHLHAKLLLYGELLSVRS